MQSNRCLTCKHYLGAHACEAFPDLIPEEIYTGVIDHSEPYEGDGGIQYEAIGEVGE